MMYFLVKVTVSALLIAAISETAKRSVFWAALLASLPVTSLLAFIWVYLEEKDTAKVSALSYNVFWLVLPSLAFFLVLPGLLKVGMDFTPALLIACVVTAALYGAGIVVYRALG